MLIVGGRLRGGQAALASALVAEGHAVRITTRTEAGRAAIEQTGAECWIGTPDRLATLRGSWTASPSPAGCSPPRPASGMTSCALHTVRLEYFLTQLIDTTVRGFLYEARGEARPPRPARAGEAIVADMTRAQR